METRSIHPELTISQQFLRDIGYHEPVSAREAVGWHYLALLRRLAFERNQAGLDVEPATLSDHAWIDRQDREQVLLELGISPETDFEGEAGLCPPESLDALLWNWVL